MAINRTSPKKGKVVDIPTAPTIGTATAGGESATVEYTAATKGGPATTFTALSSPGSITGTGSSSPITVSGLTAGTAYTFTVRGANATGSGEYSTASNSVTPTQSTSYESIATVTPSGTSVTFSSIPQTYKHLQVRLISRTTRNDASVDGIYLRMNGDTAGNYSNHFLQGNGSSASAVAGANVTVIVGAYNGADAQTGANIFSASVWDILDYTNTNKYKTTRSLFGYDDNSAGTITLGSGNWRNTAAVTSLTFLAEGNFVANSHFALYGIKG
jgi:hypothetical protein